MRKNHRRFRYVECVTHRPGRHVREIDEHSQSVHLSYDFLSKFGETTVLRRIERCVRPSSSDIVSERHIAGAEVVVLAQCSEAVLDGVSALESEHRTDLSFFLRATKIA